MYEHLCSDLELADGGIYGRTYHASGKPTGEAKRHVLIVMRDAERDRLRKVAVDCANAGIEDRRIRLAEDRARLMADVFRAVFADPELGLTAEQQEVAPTVAGRHLRLAAANEEVP
jgi:hypothetical protein